MSDLKANLKHIKDESCKQHGKYQCYACLRTANASLAERVKELELVYKSAERSALLQTAAYQSAMAHAERCDAVCRLAVRVKEASFDDPGDAVRWGEAVNAWEKKP